VDARLDRIARILCGSFDDHVISVRWIDADSGGRRRRLLKDDDIARLLRDLSGIQTSLDRHASKAPGRVKFTISYVASGKPATLTESFGRNETIVRADGMTVRLADLADAVERGTALPPPPP
jgi:hypothetical protein